MLKQKAQTPNKALHRTAIPFDCKHFVHFMAPIVCSDTHPVVTVCDKLERLVDSSELV